MDFKQLRAFLHVAELGSLSRAADRLNLTQPALSRQIKLLESDLGARLFVRTGRGVVLSEAGRRFERRTRPLVAALEDAAGEVATDSEAIAGPVVLAMLESFGPSVITSLVQRYHAAHPAAELRLIASQSARIREGLLGGRIDIGVIYWPREVPMLTAEPLWTEPISLIMPVSADDAAPTTIRLAEAVDRPLVLPGPHNGLRQAFDDAAARQGLTIRPEFEVDSLPLTLEMMRATALSALLPRRAVAADLAAGRVRAASIIDPPVFLPVALVRARDRHLGRAAAALAQMIRAEAPGWRHPDDAAAETRAIGRQDQ